ncbi:MAG: tetratricopeptide repeat protein [SAR324 cluster bacterium]|nr:tetratricopeptide repeat protein [SAR324 cluster bacterium]
MAKYTLDKKTLRKDAIRDQMLNLVDWAIRRRRWVIGGSVTLVVCVALVFAYFAYAQYQTGQQAAKFYLAEKAMNDRKMSEDKRNAAATAALTDYLETYPDSTLSPFAWMYLAQIYWSGKNFDEAGNAFQQVLGHKQTGEFTRHLAVIGEAKLHESQGRFDASAESYRSLPEDKYSDLKAFNLGRLAVAQHRNREAKSQFQKVVSRYPPSRLAKWASDAMSVLP